MIKSLIALSLSVFVTLSAVAEPTVEETIAKARAHIGGDAALKAIKNVHYVGTYSGASGEALGKLEIYLAKPNSQRLTIATDSLIEITANNQFDGYRKRINPKAPDEWAVDPLEFEELKSIQINTLENLSFFAKPTKARTRVYSDGFDEVDGKQVHKIVYKYSEDTWYRRYFEVETGRLVATENAKGLTVKEEGEVVVNGVTFPKRIISYQSGSKTNEVEFSAIEANIEMSDDLFEFPSLAD